MLCEIDYFGNFFSTWLALSIITVSITFIISGWLFGKYYMNPTYEQWTRKSNPNYPPLDKVRLEIIQTLKSIVAATLCPALTLWMSRHGYSNAYCGIEPHGWSYIVLCFFITWIGTDLYEFMYHRLGHLTHFGWLQHKHHHVFFNPTPFSVIADEYIDQFVRAAPLLIFPLIAPWNMDMMFFTFGIFFYGYGTYLHWGYELDWPDAHHYWINTAFEHHCHHAKSVFGKPYHTGFFLKIWDRICGSLWDKECFCAKCARGRGERSKEIWEKIEKVDYKPLMDWRYIWYGEKALKAE